MQVSIPKLEETGNTSGSLDASICISYRTFKLYITEGRGRMEAEIQIKRTWEFCTVVLQLGCLSEIIPDTKYLSMLVKAEQFCVFLYFCSARDKIWGS